VQEAAALPASTSHRGRSLQLPPQAADYTPRFVEAWFNLAALARDRGRTDAARRYLERAVAADPIYADAIYNFASKEFDGENYLAARRWWQRNLELDATSEWARVARHGLRFITMKLATIAGEAQT
jgi:tetratricopeptide (TPR) repeat protein